MPFNNDIQDAWKDTRKILEFLNAASDIELKFCSLNLLQIMCLMIETICEDVPRQTCTTFGLIETWNSVWSKFSGVIFWKSFFHFSLMFHFHTAWKCQKTIGFRGYKNGTLGYTGLNLNLFSLEFDKFWLNACFLSKVLFLKTDMMLKLSDFYHLNITWIYSLSSLH